MRERWQNPEYRAKALKHLNESRALQTEETRRKISETMKRVWEQVRGRVVCVGYCWVFCVCATCLTGEACASSLLIPSHTGAVPPEPDDRGGDAAQDLGEAQGACRCLLLVVVV